MKPNFVQVARAATYQTWPSGLSTPTLSMNYEVATDDPGPATINQIAPDSDERLPSTPPAGCLKPKPSPDGSLLSANTTTASRECRHFSSPELSHMASASTAPPAVAAAVPGYIAVGSSSATDAARRPARPLKRSRKDQAAEAAGLSVGAKPRGLLRTSCTRR